MNKKKYISIGFFIVVMLIGAGVAYYFDPGVVSGILGITPPQVADISDTNSSFTDAASSSAEDILQQESDSSAPVSSKGAPSDKKSTASKNVATATRIASSPKATSAATSSGVWGDASDDGDVIAPTLASSSEKDPEPSIPATACAFPGVASSMTRKIIFNEVAWMGSPSSSTGEWMEIKNISTDTIDLSGWKLANASGKVVIDLSGAGTIAPGNLFLLSRGSGAGETYSGDLVNSGDVLAIMDPQCDVSDYLDASHGWPAGNNTTKQTMERDADNVGWHTSTLPGGTPDVENSVVPPSVLYTLTITLQGSAIGANIASNPPGLVCTASCTGSYPSGTRITLTSTPGANAAFSGWSGGCSGSATCSLTITATTSLVASFRSTISAPPPPVDVPVSQPDATTTIVDNTTSTGGNAVISPGNILISAVQIAGAASDNDLVRLYNPTSAPVDMSGWKLHKRSQTGTEYSLKSFPAGSVIGAGQSFIWANSENGFSETVGANVSSTETLSADNSVALLDAAGNVVDAVAWGTGTGQYGEGPPYPTDPAANQLLSRRSAAGVMVDTDNNINDFDLQ